MKEGFLVWTFAMLVIPHSSVTAQAEPVRADYEKRIFEANDNYYVQKSLPVYLKFSVEPDGQDYPLRSKAHPEDSEPMYLDTEGVNYIRSRWAVDAKTGLPIRPQREVMMELHADGLPPKTTVKMQGAPVYRNGERVYYGKGLQFGLNASDGVSGVMESLYALNGDYTSFEKTVDVTKEGPQTLYYFSADNVGNAENTRQYSFTYDITPPVTAHSIEGIVHNQNILAPGTRFKLATTDNLSGVNHVHYLFDDNAARNYTAPVSLAGLADGEHVLYYYGEDNVKNEAAPREFKFYLDKIAPEVNHQVEGDMHVGKHRYVSERSQLNLSATDNKAGVKQVYYHTDGGSQTNYSSSFGFPNKLGWHKVVYYADDNVDNRTSAKSVNVYLDNRAPETGITYGNPQFFSRDTLFVTSQTPVRLIPRDAHSGVQSTSYGIDEGEMSPYSEFSLSGEGNHSIAFHSIDQVNNTESVKTSRAYVDNTAPEIFVNFSIEPVGSKHGLKIYPNYVRMYVGSTDQQVGTDEILYSIDGAPLRTYSSPRTLDISELDSFKKRKKYSVKVVAKDKLGNRAERTEEFYVGQPEE